MWSLHISNRDRVHPLIWSMAAKAEAEHGIVVRPMRKRDLDAEVTRFLEVYNAAWEQNWAAVPLTEGRRGARHYAKELRPILDENWAFIAERADTGEVVGAALTLPDYNQVLAHLNGRLLPFGWAKALYYRRRIDAVRVFALGVKPAYQHTGVAARFYELHFQAAERTRQKGRGDGLGARDQSPDEPRHGGHGRRGRAPLPRLRTHPIGMTMRDERPGADAASGQLYTESMLEPQDDFPALEPAGEELAVIETVRVIEPLRSRPAPLVQARGRGCHGLRRRRRDRRR